MDDGFIARLKRAWDNGFVDIVGVANTIFVFIAGISLGAFALYEHSWFFLIAFFGMLVCLSSLVLTIYLFSISNNLRLSDCFVLVNRQFVIGRTELLSRQIPLFLNIIKYVHRILGVIGASALLIAIITMTLNRLSGGG